MQEAKKQNLFRLFFKLFFELKIKFLSKETRLDAPVLNLAFNSKTKTLAMQLTNGEIHKYKNGQLTNWLFDNNLSSARFPQPCTYFSICSTPDSLEKELCVGLTDFYRLYINHKEIANNCTSFYIHDKYILYTTHDNNLKFIDLKKTGTYKNFIFLFFNRKFKIFQDGLVIEELFRRLERGSKLVTCLHNDTTCILQMPRGNLETIHPRTLVITKLKDNIDG